MSLHRSFALLIAAGLLLGCMSRPPAGRPIPNPTEDPVIALPTETDAPTADEAPATLTPAAPTVTPPAAQEITEAPLPIFPFRLPILPPGRDIIDSTYRFATTAGGEREPHHGVEFLNSSGTTVHAAAGGTVLFAGDDFNGSPYSPAGWFAFYGNFVIIEHHFAGLEEPVYTLYAHLSEILVSTGDLVNTGQPVGLVGFTGAAVGSHLHFEVRYGGTAYTDVRNPEAWLLPHAGNGSLAGSIVDAGGLKLPVFPLQLTAADGSGFTIYFSTYEEGALAYQEPFYENFALGDVPAGTYELSFVAYSLEKYEVVIRPGERSFIEIVVGDGP